MTSHLSLPFTRASENHALGLAFRESAVPRILTGVALTTIAGGCTGQVLKDIAVSDFVLGESVKLRGIRKPWLVCSAVSGFAFFATIELANAYFNKTNIYHNFATDAATATIPTYFAIVSFL